ncbi:hypothetical protein GCM10023177_52540 [Streptomyces violaceoruber]|nr:hypothetical protein JCM4020_63700 [Streptomyces coelicolor]
MPAEGGVDERQAVADEALDAEGLEQGGDARDEQRGRDQPGAALDVESAGLPDDERRSDNARVHGGDVLECGGDEPRGVELLVHRVHGRDGVLGVLR